MREIDKIAEGLFEKIRDRFEDVSLGDDEANATQDPEKARFFNFDYVVDEHNYGNVTISIVDEISLKVYFSKNISHDLSDEQRRDWYNFLKELREFAKRNLLSFEPRDITRSTLKVRDIKQVSKADSTYDKDEVISESRLSGTSRSSYEHAGPVRIIIRHSDYVNNEVKGDRARKIKAIFLETSTGERFRLPHNSLRYARAMARHMQEGGDLHDDFGKHITEMADECSKLKNFKIAMLRRVFEDEETQHMVEAAFEYHGLLKDTLNRMSGPKGYRKCAEQFVHTSTSYIPEVDVDSLRERFVKRSYNERMDDALPLVYKAYSMKKTNKFAEAFEGWASNLSEGTWAYPETEDQIVDLEKLLAEPLPVGVDAENATGALYNIIGNDELYDQLLELSNVDPDADARETIMAWIQANLPDVYDQLDHSDMDDAVAESHTGDTPIENMSRSELLDYLNLDSLKAQSYSNSELRDMAEEKAADLAESSYGSYGNVYEDDDGMTAEDLYWTIHDRIMSGLKQGQHTELLRKLGPDGLMDAMKDQAEFHAGAEEWGSSDTSGVVRSIYRQAGVEFPEMREDYGYRAPSDSSSPLTHAQQAYCDACDRPADQCVCDDQNLDEGKMKEMDIDLSELTDEEFTAKYGKTKEEMIQALSEGWDPGKLSRTAKNALAGAALAGATTLGYMGGQDIERDPYIKQLQTQYQQASKASEQAAMAGNSAKAQQLLKQAQQLKLKIHDAEAAAELGVGGERGTSYNKYEDISEMKRLAGL